MTKLLEQAIRKVTQLPTRDQNRLARKLIAEINAHSEAKTTEKVPPLLAKMIAKVKRDERAGKILEMGWDEL